MRCCTYCFADESARDLLAKTGDSLCKGACDICGSENVELYELRPESELAYQFEKMFDVFAPIDNVAESAVAEVRGSLYSLFTSIWEVFSEVDEERFYDFARALFPGDARIEEMTTGEVALAPRRGTKSVTDFAIFGAKTWDDFSHEIKHRNRYCAEVENREALDNLLNSLERMVETDTEWHRARIWNNKARTPQIDDLCEPDYHKAGEGRMSPKGVSCLYIASTPVTAMAEIRAAVHDTVAVAKMHPKERLRILDLSGIDGISPCHSEVDCAELVANIENLRRIKAELVRPMRSTDDPVEYVPTQFIADCARRLGFDGIGYDSVMQSDEENPGYNIACFHGARTHFVMDGIELFRIKGINYSI